MELDLDEFNKKLKWSSKKELLQESFNKQKTTFETALKNITCNNLNSNMTFCENTLIHGTKFDYDKLKSIKNTGILASEFIGGEDLFDETPFCADFFRINKNLSLFNFFLTMNGTRDWTGSNFLPIKPLGTQPSFSNHIDVSNCRLPFLKTSESKDNIAFIINGNYQCLKTLQEYDYYRNPNPYFVMNSLVVEKNVRGFYKPEMSAIFLGVPSTLFSAIIVGEGVENDKEKIDFLKKEFSNIPIISSSANILYIPNELKDYYNLKNINDKFNNELDSFARNTTLKYKPDSKFVERIENYRKTKIMNDDYCR